MAISPLLRGACLLLKLPLTKKIATTTSTTFEGLGVRSWPTSANTSGWSRPKAAGDDWQKPAKSSPSKGATKLGAIHMSPARVKGGIVRANKNLITFNVD
jgi:hypothetical protein